MEDKADSHSGWTFLTNHARVLLAIARNSSVRLRDVAQHSGVTERTVQAIVADLKEAGYLTCHRGTDGRRNHYKIKPGTRYRHPSEAGHEIDGLLALFASGEDDSSRA